MNHQHIHLHWNHKNQAECVICGFVYGRIYFPQLTGFFSMADYDRYEKEQPILYASTHSIPVHWEIDL